jgi:hypothetical protein
MHPGTNPSGLLCIQEGLLLGVGDGGGGFKCNLFFSSQKIAQVLVKEQRGDSGSRNRIWTLEQFKEKKIWLPPMDSNSDH